MPDCNKNLFTRNLNGFILLIYFDLSCIFIFQFSTVYFISFLKTWQYYLTAKHSFALKLFIIMFNFLNVEFFISFIFQFFVVIKLVQRSINCSLVLV